MTKTESKMKLNKYSCSKKVTFPFIVNCNYTDCIFCLYALLTQTVVAFHTEQLYYSSHHWLTVVLVL